LPPRRAYDYRGFAVISAPNHDAEPLDTNVAIETPEHIVFRYRVAGPARRLLAYIVDLLLVYTGLFIFIFVLLLAIVGASEISNTVDTASKTGIGVLLLAFFAVEWVYFAAWEGAMGRTPGKMAAGLRVVTTEGRPIGFREAALRNLLRAVDRLPSLPFPLTLVGAYVPALASIALSRRFRRLGDLVAGTMVIVPERARATTALRLWPPAAPHELAAVPDDVTLDADERNAIELFLRRRGTLGPAREHELASMIIEPLAKRFGFRLPDPTRMLALLYDRAANAGRLEAPPSSREDALRLITARGPENQGPGDAGGRASWR
jgi:uncharacterized RDD family membrane protein YckC